MTVRWTFQDVETSTVVTLPVNPDQADSYRIPKTLTYGTSGSTKQAHAAPIEWSFSGVIFTEAHYELLKTWAKKTGKLRVTDHLGRTFEIMVSQITFTDRRPTPTNQWRFRYSMKTLLLRRTA